MNSFSKRLVWISLIIATPVLANINTEFTRDSSRIVGHERLQQAIRYNSPPSGYVDLSHCETVKNIGDMPSDNKTYRISFDDNFTFNPDTGDLSTVIEVAMQQTQMLGNTPILVSLPVTTIISSAPKSPYLRYQVVMSDHERTNMRLYMCPWESAVYLWK